MTGTQRAKKRGRGKLIDVFRIPARDDLVRIKLGKEKGERMVNGSLLGEKG